jgi:hypothetical protein
MATACVSRVVRTNVARGRRPLQPAGSTSAWLRGRESMNTFDVKTLQALGARSALSTLEVSHYTF